MKIINQYKEYFEELSKKYEKSSLAVMMQVGDFYEFYGVENEDMNFGNVTKIASLLDIVRSRKNKECEYISIDSPLFTGFPKHSASKYIKKLIENDYYVIIIDQYGETNNITRKITKILSKGTYIDDLTNTNSTTMASIYYGDDNSIGIAFVDLSIGSCKAFEIKNEQSELTRLLEAENPCEILKYSYNGSIGKKILDNILKPKFQEVILKYYYPNTGFLDAIEFIDLDMKPNARIALVILLEEAKFQDPEIVKKLSKPIVNEDNSILKLEDTALYQLGIVSETQKKENLFNIINKTATQQGKRLLKKNLLAPLTCISELNNRYEMVNQFRNCNITQYLKSLVDIEKYVHKWMLGKMSPHEFVILVYCFPMISNIIKNVEEHTKLRFNNYAQFINFENTIKNTFKYDLLEKYYSLSNIESNIFKKGVKCDLDKLQEHINNLLSQINTIVVELNEKDKTDKKQAIIKFEKTASNDQWYLSTTTKRIESLNKVKALKDFTVKNQRSNVRIFSDKIDNIRIDYVDTLNNMIELVKQEFVKQLNTFENDFGDMMKELVSFLSWVDFYNCGSLLVNNFGYNKPTIIEKNESFIKCTKLRHAIIERLDNSIDFVPNDIELPENNQSGMLLFGLNGGGKSSYMKSVGLCVVLAQIGYWVPCETMEYYPFTKLFTRISGDDNLIKGLSSFAVEMKELRNILQKSDNRSLVLGDEICKGTEQDSALGIVSASLITLSNRNKSRFIFATHLHALSKMEEINTKVNIYHLSVECKNDNIIYHRKLLPGSGQSLYGLEVARHLLHDMEVIKLAEKLRPKPIEDLVKESKYNSNVIVKQCEICQDKCNLDVHHIQFQCSSNQFNLVQNGTHKNSKSNLVVLCKKHHNEVHQDKIKINGWKETSDGIILDWENINYITKSSRKSKYNEEQILQIKQFKNSSLSKKIILMKLKDEFNIDISIGTFNKYINQ
jgi:DNA mismatch repair protein MutS